MTRSLESSQVSLRSSLKDNLLEKFDSKLSLCGRNIFGDRRLLSYIIIISVGNWDFLVGILISQQFELVFSCSHFSLIGLELFNILSVSLLLSSLLYDLIHGM